MPFESTKKEPKVAFWPTSTVAALPDATVADTFVGMAVAWIAGAMVSVGAIGVADAQAETMIARTARLEIKNLFFIYPPFLNRSSHVFKMTIISMTKIDYFILSLY
jgi:hypothetical protein